MVMKRVTQLNMYIKVDHQTNLLNIVVADKLPYPVVLGRDLPVLFDLFESDKIRKCYAVVTRGQAKKSNEHLEILSTLPFYSDEITPRKSRKTRRQRRQEKFLHTVVKSQTNTQPELPLGFQMPASIINMQKSIFSISFSENQEGARR